MTPDAEVVRLAEDARRQKNWKRWGPYLSERQWATVREDYSADGDAWNYFPHAHARSRAYRWGEDGLLGICDRECRLCFSVALWNGQDDILKERLFGLTNSQGNHGEDVKEVYFYLDATPTSSYLKAQYRYPQAAFPYDELIAENARRSKLEPEFELIDTGVLDGNRFFDVVAEYAKASPDDILIRLTIHNRAAEPADIAVLPTLWFRNTWAWGGTTDESQWPKPSLVRNDSGITAEHTTLGRWSLAVDSPTGTQPEIVFTENETDLQTVFSLPNPHGFVKDAFYKYVIAGDRQAVKRDGPATKAAVIHRLHITAGGQVTLRLRLTAEDEVKPDPFGSGFDATFAERIAEADAFYAGVAPSVHSRPERAIARQAFAGLLWSKQFYMYIVDRWENGDPAQPAPPPHRGDIRNGDWPHVFSRDVISMPDAWEYPWFAAWDLAFHLLPLSRIDPEFAKHQALLFLREWYMHPNGQLPAYEWNFSDVNPPVHAWACWRIYKMTGPHGSRDRQFLARCFHKLLLNFTWWVNRKDIDGKHLFAGGFLGLDNVSIFDRSKPLPNGVHLEQADGTAWMAFFCLTMLAMALELASQEPEYEDVASKFFEHFVAIADAMNHLGGTGLWDEEDGFYYDRLHASNGSTAPARLRSVVGLIPLFAVEVLREDVIDRLPGFKKRLDWFLAHRKDLAKQVAYCERAQGHGLRLLAIPTRARLERVLRHMLDEDQLLSPFGVRSLSKAYGQNPYVVNLGGQEFRVEYLPGESDSGMFGGNSNWRGPVWFPVNFLLVEALQRYHHFYGDDFRVECPVGSGTMLTLDEVARELSRRLTALFLPDADGMRPCNGADRRWADDPLWRDHILFHEYFHGDNGAGLGASHQTGWTSLVVRLLEDSGRICGPNGELCAVDPGARSASKG